MIGFLDIPLTGLTITSGGIITIAISGTAISSISNCQVLSGLTPLNTETPTCTLLTGLSMKITGFSAGTSANFEI